MNLKGKILDGFRIFVSLYIRDEQGHTWIVTDLARFPSRSDILKANVSYIKDGLWLYWTKEKTKDGL